MEDGQTGKHRSLWTMLIEKENDCCMKHGKQLIGFTTLVPAFSLHLRKSEIKTITFTNRLYLLTINYVYPLDSLFDVVECLQDAGEWRPPPSTVVGG